MSQMYTAEYIMFDYTGYGVSRLSTVGEEIICEDMKIVLAWADRPLNKVILWGFSLGTYPIVNIAAQFPVRALLLQSPIGSVSCMFYKNYDVDIKFKQDYFASINHIANVKAKNIMILHSDSDEIIPLKQAKLLYDKYVRKHGDARIDFIEVEGIKHNSMNKYISAIS